MKLTLFLLLACVAVGSNMSPTCGLDCFHNGYCEAGSANFSEHPTQSNGTALAFLIETKRNGYHCHCRPGYTGLLCGIKYEDCTDSDQMCYNGGQCILGLSDIYGNDQLYCDCNEAIDEHGVIYVGKYCEIPKTQTCDDAGEVFCVNGGWCKSDYASYPRRPCHCGTLHDGPHCEFDAGAVPECTLKCHNGGACRLGIKKDASDNGEIDYDFWKAHSDYQYCECADGYYGLQCEVQSSKCGDHHCFHGGECIAVTQDGQHMHYCDCTKAVGNGIAYAGEFCQYESDNFCDKENTANGQLFCVNDGVCHSDTSLLGCECPTGFHGPICEFKDAIQVNEYENCTLVCENNGQCRNGAKDTSLLDKFGDDLSNVSVSHDSNFEHCVCPDGFAGLTCETKIEVCQDAEHVCLFGSTCIPDQSDGIGSACNCETGSTSFVMLAGTYCQHKSTSICSSGGSSSSGFSFCVNKGECVDIIGEDGKEQPGCECPEAFYGPHCEFLKRDEIAGDPEKDGDDGDDGDDGIGIPVGYTPVDVKENAGVSTTNSATAKNGLSVGGAIGIILVAIACTLLVAILYRRHTRRKSRSIEDALREVQETNQFMIPLPNTKTRRYRDFLGDPDIPDMDSPIRPTTSYHDHVFSNVEIL